MPQAQPQPQPEPVKLQASIPPTEPKPDLPGGTRTNEEIDAILAAQKAMPKPEPGLADAAIDDVAKTSMTRLLHSIPGGLAEGGREMLRTGVMAAEDVLVSPWYGIGNHPSEITAYYDSLFPHYYDKGQPGEGQAPQTAVENISQGLTQFLGSFGMAGKVLKAAELGPAAANIGAGLVTDIGAFSEDMPNISDLIGPLHPYIQKYVTDILTTQDHNVPALERKIRTGLTGMMPPAIITSLIQAARTGRTLWHSSVTQNMLADERGSLQVGGKTPEDGQPLKLSNPKLTPDSEPGGFKQVKIKDLQVDDAVHPDKVNPAKVQSLREMYSAGKGKQIPPIEVERDAKGVSRVTDGRHRLQAAHEEGYTSITANVTAPLISKPEGPLLNIGLHIGDGTEKLKPEVVLEALKSRGLNVKRFEIAQSKTEPTLIAELDRPLSEVEGKEIAVALRQDAIAQSLPGNVGALYGPKAEEWGPFNPEFFLKPSDPAIRLTNDPAYHALYKVDEKWKVPENWGRSTMPTVGAGIVHAGENTPQKFAAAWKDLSAQYTTKKWTAAEIKSLHDASIERLASRFTEQGGEQVLQKIETIKSYIDQGMWNNGWYDNMITTFKKFIPEEDIKQAIEIMAVYSPGMDTEKKWINGALYAHGLMKAGVKDAKEFAKHLEAAKYGAVYPNNYAALERIAAGERGARSTKVGPFNANMLGDLFVSTMDRHMGSMFGFGEMLTVTQSEFMRSTFAQLGKQYGMEPARLQAAAWGAFRELERQVPRAQQHSLSKLVEDTDTFNSGTIPKPPTGLDESGRISYGLAFLLARATVGATAGAYATDGSEIGALVGLLAGASGPAAVRTLVKMAGSRTATKTASDSTAQGLLRSSSPQDVYTKFGDIRRNYLANVEAQTRGVRPDELVQAEAKMLTDAGQVDKHFVLNYLGKPGSLLNDSEILAVGSVIDEEAVKGQMLVTHALKTGTPEAYAEGFKQIELLSNMGAVWKGFVAETGRSERTLGVTNLIRGVTQWAKNFEAALKETGGTPRELFAQFATLTPRQAAVYAQSLNKPGTWEMWRELWINSLLWGKALVVNPIGNALQLEWEIGKRASLEMVGAVPPGTTYNMFKEQARIHGLRDALVAGYRSVLKGTDDLGKVDMAHEPAITAANAGVPPGLFGTFIDAFGSFVRGSGNILRGEDAFARGIAGRVALREYAYRTAYQEMQGLQLNKNLQGPRVEGKQAVQLLQQRIDDIMSNPPLEAISYYKNFEKVVTFTEELGPAGQALQQFQQTRIGTVTTPFVKVLYNIPKQAARNSPLAPVLPSFWADVNSGDPHRRNLAIAGMAMGSGLSMILADLATNGVITGNGPSDPRERVLMKERLGWKPMSVRIGDEYISLNQAAAAFAVPMGIMADYVYLKQHMLEGEVEDFALLMTQSFANNFANKTFMKGLAGWLSALTDPEQGAKRAISDFVTSLAPFSTAVRIAEQEMDPFQREAHTILEKVQSRLPILSKGLPIHPDIFGNPVAVEGAIGPDALSPLYFSTIKDDKVSLEMQRVGAFPGDHSSSVMGTPLTTPEISRLAVIAGKEVKAPNSKNEDSDLYKMIEDVIASDDYKAFKNFPDMQKSVIQSVISKYRAAGAKLLLNENADLRNRVTATFKKKGAEVSAEDFQLD